MNEKLLEVRGTQSSIIVEVKAQADAQMAIVQSAESKVTEIIKKQVDERKKLITERYDAEKKAIEDTQALYNSQNTTDDYGKNLSKEQAIMNDINSKITSAQRNTSTASGQARMKQLQDEKTAQQDKIDAMVLARGRDINNTNFDKAKTNLDKQQQDENTALDKKYSDEEITKMAKDAVLSGLLKNTQGAVVSLTSAYIDFENRFGSGMSAMGKSVQDNLIANLTEATQLINTMNGNGTLKAGVTVSVGGTVQQHADGGIITKAMLLSGNHIAGENGSEAIIPLSNKNAVLPFANAVASQFLPMMLNNFNMPKMNIPNISGRNSSPSVNFNEPFMIIQGNVTDDMMPKMNSIVKDATDMVTRKLMKVLVDQGGSNH